MFDVGFWEMAFISIIALVVIGPERLPGAARTAGMWVGKARRMVADVKTDIKREMDANDSLSGVKEIKEEITSATKDLRSDFASTSSDGNKKDPLGIRAVSETIKSSVDDVSSVLKDAEKAANEANVTAKSGSQKLPGELPGEISSEITKTTTNKQKTNTASDVSSTATKKVVKKKVTEEKASVKKSPPENLQQESPRQRRLPQRRSRRRKPQQGKPRLKKPRLKK